MIRTNNVFTMKTILLSFLFMLFGFIRCSRKRNFLLPSSKPPEFMDSKKMLMSNIIKDLNEEAPIRCLHYVIDSDIHDSAQIIPRPEIQSSEFSVPIKIVDYRKIRSRKVSLLLCHQVQFFQLQHWDNDWVFPFYHWIIHLGENK